LQTFFFSFRAGCQQIKIKVNGEKGDSKEEDKKLQGCHNFRFLFQKLRFKDVFL